MKLRLDAIKEAVKSYISIGSCQHCKIWLDPHGNEAIEINGCNEEHKDDELFIALPAITHSISHFHLVCSCRVKLNERGNSYKITEPIRS